MYNLKTVRINFWDYNIIYIDESENNKLLDIFSMKLLIGFLS